MSRRRLLWTLLTFIAISIASGFILRIVILFLLTKESSQLLAWVLIGTPLIAIFTKQRWLWTVFIVAVLLYAFIGSGVLVSSLKPLWIITTLICGIGGTIYIRRPHH